MMTQQYLDLYKKIQQFSLDDKFSTYPFSKRLACENGWSLEYTQQVIDEYKKYMFLAVTAGHQVTPSDQVDQAWHLHMLYTQSYWDRFCGQVLGKPVHHSPTKGGTLERKKYTVCYLRTLDSYQKFFGEKPVSEVWPAPEVRFGEDLHFSRVNNKRYWIISKPPLNRPATFLCVVLICVLIFSGCVLLTRGNDFGLFLIFVAFLIWAHIEDNNKHGGSSMGVEFRIGDSDDDGGCGCGCD